MIYKRYIIALCLVKILVSCGETEKANGSADIMEQSVGQQNQNAQAIRSSKFRAKVGKKAVELYNSGTYVSFDSIKRQMKKVEGKLARFPSPPSVKLNTENLDIYPYMQKRCLLIISLFSRKNSSKIEMVTASGGAISENGIILTNYHVINPAEKVDFKAMYAADYQGNVYAITEVLAGSKHDDLAILKMDTNGNNIEFYPLAEQELVGEDIYAMGHPFKMVYLMTDGIIARQYIRGKSKKSKINITAEFGRGSSGGPIINENGELVAINSATRPNYTGRGKNGDLQLTIQEAIPISTIQTFLKK